MLKNFYDNIDGCRKCGVSIIRVFYSVNTVGLLCRCATGRLIGKKNRSNQSSDSNESLTRVCIENFSRDCTIGEPKGRISNSMYVECLI